MHPTWVWERHQNISPPKFSATLCRSKPHPYTHPHGVVNSAPPRCARFWGRFDNYGIALNCILALANASSSSSTSSCDGSTAPAAAVAQAPIRKGRLGPVTRDNVRNLFRLSSAMVFGIENSSEMKDSLHSSSCICLRSQIALLQMVVTNNLIYVAIKQRTEVEFNEYCYSMQRLLFNVEMQHARLPMSDGRLAAAA